MAGILASSRIVGRAAELAALNDALRLATEGEPSFVLIGGDGLTYGPFREALRELGLELPPRQLRELIGGVAPELVAIAPSYVRFLGKDEPGDTGDTDDDGPTSPA